MAGALLRLTDEKWGERFLRAYYASKERYGPQEVSWRKLAARVSKVLPAANSTVMRLRYLEDAPVGAAQRQLAYLAVLALGFDPQDFGLTEADASPGWHMPTVRKLVAPQKARDRASMKRCTTAPAGRSDAPRPVLLAA